MGLVLEKGTKQNKISKNNIIEFKDYPVIHRANVCKTHTQMNTSFRKQKTDGNNRNEDDSAVKN